MKMTWRTGAVVLSAVWWVLSTAPVTAQTDGLPEVEVVGSVDLEQFAGEWFLIAEIPSFFERRCAGGQKAEYVLNDDGSVTVINSCVTRLGFTYTRAGRAFVADQQSNAKLRVSFVRFFGLWPFRGDYWIMKLGKNYQWALIGHPTREYGWVLSRTCDLRADTLAYIRAHLEDQLYDFDDFVMVDQSSNGCPAVE